MEFTTLALIILIAEVSYLVYKSGLRMHRSSKSKLFVDTSALMDGRIVTAAQTGFIPENIVVPRSVINELQLLADQADHEKRSRARRGLDAVTELQDMKHLSVDVVDDGKLGSGGVDERLIDLARSQKGSICTIDFNLNKAATALGVRVLNINELAGGIRMAFLPGETISITLSQKGQSNTQAVGYLADGTMVVVDKAASKLNQTVEIEFIRSLQTAAGRMMFAKLAKDDQPKKGGESVTPIKKRQQSDGRRKAVNKDSAPNPEVISTEESTPVQSSSKASPRRSNRRKSGEDSLMDLVNRQ
ncbi:hypothetical protein H7142_02525 [Candidatus Saccharibacteria bacterium]|nr:hypothetical protein [Candidatus Saccharibacteria bacterium]